jgi:hypothetical protein
MQRRSMALLARFQDLIALDGEASSTAFDATHHSGTEFILC